jgi:ubiquitin-protein ligase
MASDHLEQIHRQLQEAFARHPLISIVPGKGQPPEVYQLNYRIAGLVKNEQGEILPTDGHTVELAIPFGFPHFPPSCKPKTPLFHPDFDPAAICLADFWVEQPDLVLLVVQIGRMINGEIFSTENAFNDEAAEWYGHNRQRFPLAQVQWWPATPAESISPTVVDTLEDTDILEDFDFLSIAGDEEEQPGGDDVGHRDRQDPPQHQPDTPLATPGPGKKVAKKRLPPRREQTQIDPSPPAAKDLKPRWGKRLILSLLLLATLLLAGGGYAYHSLLRQFDTAANSYSLCQSSLAVEDFTAAETLCRQARHTLQTIPFVQRQRVARLEQEIDTILSSEQLQQGLAGNILVDGRYLAKDEHDLLLEVAKERAKAEELIRQKSWQEASLTLQRLLKSARQLNSAELTEQLQQRLSHTTFHWALTEAHTLRQQEKWAEASGKIDQATQLLPELAASEQAGYREELAGLRRLNQLEETTTGADQLFADGEWEKAQAAYQAALAATKEIPQVAAETTAGLRERLQRAELYRTIEQGNQAFSAGEWETAIGHYQEAAELLARYQGSLSAADSASNRRKLARIILQAAIIKERQIAAAALQDDDRPRAQASYQRIVAAIDRSDLAGDSEFATLRDDFMTASSALAQEIALAEKEEYLRQNFRHLFVAHYPGTSEESLGNFQVKLERETPGELIFRLQCSETSHGRPLTLVMYYAYDKLHSNWRLSPE